MPITTPAAAYLDVYIGTSFIGGQSWYNAKLIDNTIQEGLTIEINQVLMN